MLFVGLGGFVDDIFAVSGAFSEKIFFSEKYVVNLAEF